MHLPSAVKERAHSDHALPLSSIPLHANEPISASIGLIWAQCCSSAKFERTCDCLSAETSFLENPVTSVLTGYGQYLWTVPQGVRKQSKLILM